MSRLFFSLCASTVVLSASRALYHGCALTVGCSWRPGPSTAQACRWHNLNAGGLATCHHPRHLLTTRRLAGPERLPSSGKLRLSRLAALVAVAVAFGKLVVLRAPLSVAPMTLGGACALQAVSVACAVEAATKRVAARRCRQLLLAHGLLSGLSLALLAMAVQFVWKAVVVQEFEFGLGLRAAAVVAGTFTGWACVNGTVSLLDPRSFPPLLKLYLTKHFGSVARGKGLFVKYHRTVGALAYASTTTFLCLALLLGAMRPASSMSLPLPVGSLMPAMSSAALLIAMVVLLGPSLLRRRFSVPSVSISSERRLVIHL